ncbi:MFS transporter, partial [Nocardia sp. NPDC049190]|uniref:MFS transporter n=1 Tax=Nocardia sp. NPDC049190 TaxID=3155650 RepID=UPI0033F69B8E
MSPPSALLPVPGPQRTLAFVTLASAIAAGIYLSSGVLYFTRIVRIPAIQVGWGLSVAGALSVVAVVVGGQLADRRGPRTVLSASFFATSAATVCFLAVRGFGSYLLIVPVAASVQATAQVIIGTVINRVTETRVNEFRAYIRSVLNVGFAVGAGLAGVAAHMDSPTVYRLLITLDAVFLLAAAVLTRRLPHLPPIPTTPHQHRWIALRDRPYLALSVLDGILSLQHRILAVAVPLWILEATTAPRWTIASADLVNTAIVVALQIRFCRGIDNPRTGGLALRRSGWAFLLACGTLAWASGRSSWLAVVVVLCGVAILSVGELWQSAGGFEVSNSLAPPHAIGEYLGVFGTGLRLAETV